MPAARVGWLVARARAVAGIADRDLAVTVGVPLRTIRRWERGDLVPTDDEIEAIATACGTRLTELLPRRAPVSYDAATGIMRMGDQAVAIPGSMLDNDAVLGAYIGMVRRQRGLRPDQDVKIRQEDLEALGDALDLDDDELEERLVRVIGMSRNQAAAVRAQLLRRRLAVPMVGMLAGLSLLGLNRLFTTATEEVRTVAGGALTRGNPFLPDPTTTTASSTPIVINLPTSAIPATTNTAPAVPATLPPVVTAEPAPGPQQDVRTGPPRTPRRDASDPTDPPTDATVDTTPVPAPPTTPPVTVAPTTPAATTPTTTPPDTSGPVVPTLPPGGEAGTTELPPPTTTTTVPPDTTTTVPPATTTTTPTVPGGGTLGGDNSGTSSGSDGGTGGTGGTGGASGDTSGGTT
jgi:transcriptional regulator with XRE-family HTH domain